MNNRRKRSICDLAKSLLNSHGFYQPGFSIGDLTEAVSIPVIRQSLTDDVSGASMIDGDRKVITINQNHSKKRRRFTIAHELGHIFLKHDTSLNINEGETAYLYRDQASSEGSDWREIEANYFAACLLMPKELVEQEILKTHSHNRISESVIENLAETFKVSEIAMSIRLSSLGYL